MTEKIKKIVSIANAKRVYDLLPGNGSRIRRKDLKGKARNNHLSPTILDESLNSLCAERMCLREVDTAAHPPAVYYRRVTPDLFPLGKSFYELAVGDIQEVMEEIFGYDNEEELKDDLILLLKIEFAAIIFLLAKAIENAISKGKPEEAVEYMNLVCKLHIEPWLHGLALICWGTKNVSPEAIDHISNFFAGIADSEFKKWLELTQDEHKQRLMEIIQKREK